MLGLARDEDGVLKDAAALHCNYQLHILSQHSHYFVKIVVHTNWLLRECDFLSLLTPYLLLGDLLVLFIYFLVFHGHNKENFL